MAIYPAESFYRGTIRQSIANNTSVPFTLKVSKIPTLTSWLLTISPNTANEEIIEYSGVDWTALTITVVKRWISPSAQALTVNGTDYNNSSFMRNHSQNDSIRWDVNHIHIIQDYVVLQNQINTKLNKIWELRTWLSPNWIITTDWGWNEVVSFASWWVPTGMISPYAWSIAPAWYLLCDGAAVSRSTYSELMSVIAPTKGVFTITIASPWVVSLASHWMLVWDSFYATTTGTLPTGMVANTIYYVSATWFTANTFQFSATRWWVSINTTGSQSGVHTLVYCPYGLWNGSTTFNVPNTVWRVIAGLDNSQAEFRAQWTTWGSKTHTLSASEMPTHRHNLNWRWWASTWWPTSRHIETNLTTEQSLFNDLVLTTWPDAGMTDTGWGQAHNNLQPYLITNHIIKT